MTSVQNYYIKGSTLNCSGCRIHGLREFKNINLLYTTLYYRRELQNTLRGMSFYLFTYGVWIQTRCT